MRLLSGVPVLLLSLFAACASAEWGGCVNPDDPKDPGLVLIGAKTTVCLTIGPGGNWGDGVKYSRFTFRPEADEYSRFHIPGSYKTIVDGDMFESDEVSVHVASDVKLSFLRYFYEKETQRIYPHLTAIIDVNKGVVGGIAWDDACVFCNSGRCEENTYDFSGNSAADLDEKTKGCYFDRKACDEMAKEEGTACDVTLHVVWTGTDIEGMPMVSSNSRFSAFPPEQIQNRIKDQIDKFKMPNFPDFNPF